MSSLVRLTLLRLSSSPSSLLLSRRLSVSPSLFPLVRLEGLPFAISENEIKSFMKECKVGNVELVKDASGLKTGTGYAELESDEDLEQALKLNEKDVLHYGRYAIVQKCEQAELEWYRRRQNLQDKPKFCVAMRGVPYRASEYNLANFFAPKADCLDVHVHYNKSGRPSGQATAFFASEEDAERAMELDHRYLGERYVELRRVNDVNQKHMLRMSGLPFTATTKEMLDFFKPAAECKFVKIVYDMDGRPSGSAIAEFASEEMLQKALSRNREHLGDRFVILTREHAHSALLEQTSRSSGNNQTLPAGFSLKMKGLPFRVSSGEIVDWFADKAKCSEVKLLFDYSGRPSGGAIATFASREEANLALSKHREYLGERYVELMPLF